MARVSQKREFDGRCEECGDVADLRDSSATALLQSEQTHAISAIGTKLVVGPYCGHAYFILDWKTQIEDPFDEDETSRLTEKYQRLIDIELPPPPKEDS